MARAASGFPRHRSRVALLALIALLAVSATGALRYYLRTPGSVDAGRRAKLAKIVGNHRLTRARLSGGYAFAKCQADSSREALVRGLACVEPPPTSWPAADKLREFAAEMRAAEGTVSPASSPHTAAIWDLVWGRTDDAVAKLRESARRGPSDARALNDLAVALSDHAEKHDDPSALVDAFVAADSAVRLDGSMPEAQFTIAVLLEELYLRSDAAAAWKRYLELDSRSPWATEARERLAALAPRADRWKDDSVRLRRAAVSSDSQTVRSIVADSPSDARELIQKTLDAWGAAFSAGDTANARADLDFARAIASPLRAATGDALMNDAVAAIDRAFREKRVDLMRALAEGHANLANGIALYDAFKYAGARAKLVDARKLLAIGASPMTGWALLFEARAQLRDEQESALAQLTSIRGSTPKEYLVLRSFAAQYQGFVYDVRSDYVHLLAAYDSALTESATTHEPQIALRVGSWLADAEAVLRGKQAGWRARYKVLAASPRYPMSYRPLYSVFDYVALATANEAPRLSLRYGDELVRIARQISDTNRIAYALRRRAEQFARIGQADRARADIAAALDIAGHIANPAGREKLVADVTLSGAHIALRSAPTDAEAGLRRVVDEYKAVKYEKGLSEAYLYLAQSRAAAGAIDLARVAFDSATNLMQRQRATVAGYSERRAFLDAARTVIDQIVAFHAGQSGSDAFEYFEGTRSRVLLEQLEEARGSSNDLPNRVLPALQRSLAKDDVVLSYAVLPAELLVWTIGRDRFEQHRLSLPAADLETMVNQFQRSLLESSVEPAIRASQQLHRVLVAAAGRLPTGAHLIVIPDKWIHFVPFAALRDSVTGRYLVQDHAVSYAPSARLSTSDLASTAHRFSRSSRVLAIGNPAFDQRAFRLPDLPFADGEARRIAALYDGGILLTGRDASDGTLARLAPTVEILHYAGHAVVGRDAPQLSHLVLASDGHSDGAVFSTEIARWKLTRARLAILSGCSTADGTLSATEGASSLARAFFAAGVPAVVSSLWAIDDDDTAEFFVAFHRRLSHGSPAVAALRDTQLEWMGDGRTSAHPMRSWAAFQLFGG
jgi:CHAT domain-containing protein